MQTIASVENGFIVASLESSTWWIATDQLILFAVNLVNDELGSGPSGGTVLDLDSARVDCRHVVEPRDAKRDETRE